MKRISLLTLCFCLGVGVTVSGAENPFVGRWALTIPGGGAGWLGVTEAGGYYDASILWGGGSVVPTASVFFNDDQMFVLRLNEVRRRDADGKVVRTQQFPEVLTARVYGDSLELTRMVANSNGQGLRTEQFSGKRIPALPPAPDLGKVKFGDPVTLFNGKDLSGWRLTDAGQKNGWFVKDGILMNDPKQEEGKPHVSYGNLRTDKEFEDFNLKLEMRLIPDGNSGVYLRGIYEVQVADSYGKPLDSHHMGGIYSRITPTVNAEKPAGEWQTYDITLVDRHVTVVLNGKKIIDNQPLLGCTGGALTSDEFRPGPLYLQGDHTGVSYRNLVLSPVLK
ncbi:MAG: 3-keto-disaccharide hydrolase [Limisphaerales bacterium]